MQLPSFVTLFCARSICGSLALSDLDEQGAKAYAAALSAASGKNLVRAWQRNWLQISRNDCNDEQCLRKALPLHNSELNEFAQGAAVGPTSGVDDRFFQGKPDRHSAQIVILAPPSSRARVQGSAVWVGNAATGNVNTGEIDGVAHIVSGNEPTYDNDHCHLAMTPGNGSIIVKALAGSQCGGMKVTFDGDYRKVTGAK